MISQEAIKNLDFSAFNIPAHQLTNFIEDLFNEVLVEIERVGVRVELGRKSGPTRGGYYGGAFFEIYNYPPVTVSINFSVRNRRQITPEIETIASDFVSTYNLYRLPQELLVGEKIDALRQRKKARDFYDLYFIMRKNLLTLEQKRRLAGIRDLVETENIDYKTELSPFLPQDQQAIVKDFPKVLLSELKRQVG